MEMENLDKTKEVLQEAMNGMIMQVGVRVDLSKGEVLKIGLVAGVAGLIGMTAYSEVRGWFARRKYKKQMENMFSNES